MISLICRIFFKKLCKWTYVQNRNRLMDIGNKLTVIKKEKGERGINWELGINMYTLLYIKQRTSKDLLCSTGNYTQYLATTYKEKEHE